MCLERKPKCVTLTEKFLLNFFSDIVPENFMAFSVVYNSALEDI